MSFGPRPQTIFRYFVKKTDLEAYIHPVLILDEAHERSVNTDILFGLMKKAIERRAELKVLITSATLDSEKFSKFFNNCPVFFVPGNLWT